MKVPLSWLKEFVDIDLSIEELARLLTMIGLEVEGIHLVGLDPQKDSAGNPQVSGQKHEFAIDGLTWPADFFVVARVDEVLPHPNADRLVLCRLNDGKAEYTVLTGAPNLFEFKGKGALEKPLKVAYARQGAQLYDGHQSGNVITVLKPMKIRGVESSSMICSEKELGISEEHEGVIILDDDAPEGMPLVEYMGDAVLEINILPNMIRNACVLGIAREISVATHKPLRHPTTHLPSSGASVEGQAQIKITDPTLNPRFVVGLVRDAKAQPSPYKVQMRLKLAGMRPINSIVDTTNYIMLEVGEPLHAFDYDVLLKRAGGKTPTIITRAAKPKEKLTTLDDVERTLDDFTILVTDTAGALSLAGVMGGLESEVTDSTCNVLLEGATWNLVNTRRTMLSQRLQSEASYRFSRGIHPALAETGVRLGLDRMAQWSGGEIAAGIVDAYPKVLTDPEVSLSLQDVENLLGIRLAMQEITEILQGLEFTCRVEGDTVIARTSPHRLDIGEGVIGKADLLEEIARLHGYDKVPATRMADELPPQRNFPIFDRERQLQDILVNLGMQEVFTYRLTSPETVERLSTEGTLQNEIKYVEIQNPITNERRVMRSNLLASLLEIMEKNSRLSDHLAMFEIGPVFLPREGKYVLQEPMYLAIAMSGRRFPAAWDQKDSAQLDFYDLKGVVEKMLQQLNIVNFDFQPDEQKIFHPGKCARLIIDGVEVGVLGEIHPLVKEHYDLLDASLLAASINLEILLNSIPAAHETQAIPTFPPVLEDVAVIVEEETPSQKVVEVIRKAGGEMLSAVRLFDIFRGSQIGEGKKSLAYGMTYQAPDHTLTDEEAGIIRERIIQAVEKELAAQVRR